MRKIKAVLPWVLLAIGTAFGAAGCSGGPEKQTARPDPDPGPQPDEHCVVIAYEELEEVFPNPERGFYYPCDYRFEKGAIPSALGRNTVAANRSLGHTLFLMEYFLRDFIDKPLSEDCLSLIRANMETLRAGGAKCILRFAYSDSDAESAKPWDAEEQVVMEHIAQLAPILRTYADVIYVVQAGFVGVWGEWYYTDHFGFQPKTAEDYLPRRRVVDALLAALPEHRMVALRTPQAKMMCYNLTGADSITRATAFDGSVRSRIAAHNDCFLADVSDVGTFNNKAEREFWMADTRYASMGGETCGLSSYCSCANSLSEMEKYHWSYLNIGYHREVIEGWRNGECFDQIERRLGYRFVLTEGSYTREPASGQRFRARFALRNDGFAAPTNPRDAELVLVCDADPLERHVVPLDSDPRFWSAGAVQTFAVEFDCPKLRAGAAYTLCLHLPDPAPELRGNPLFSIRTANARTWDETTGMNRLYTFTAK